MNIKILFAASIVVLLGTAVAQPREIDGFSRILIDAALERTKHHVLYDGRYRRISFPGGDVPDSIGVCTDLVIRSYRVAGIDLQKEVHADMSSNFESYPSNWGLTGPDPNIDHRRVLNLQIFFRRMGAALAITDDPKDYHPGDLVAWMLPGNIAHIGLVTDLCSADGARPLIVHNIGYGPKVEDILFRFEITGHYRYRGSTRVMSGSPTGH